MSYYLGIIKSRLQGNGTKTVNKYLLGEISAQINFITSVAMKCLKENGATNISRMKIVDSGDSMTKKCFQCLFCV